MSLTEVWLIAIGLAMDCLAVSIASGIFLKRRQLRPILFMAFLFGLFQAIMPLIGWSLSSLFSNQIKSIDHWIAFIILCLLGYRMIRESFKEDENCKQGIDTTNIKILFTLAIATSIDALAVGASFSFLGIDNIANIICNIIIIGIVSFVFSVIGSFIGSSTKKACELRAELFGGIILIVIGSKILIEHMFLNS